MQPRLRWTHARAPVVSLVVRNAGAGPSPHTDSLDACRRSISLMAKTKAAQLQCRDSGWESGIDSSTRRRRRLHGTVVVTVDSDYVACCRVRVPAACLFIIYKNAVFVHALRQIFHPTRAHLLYRQSAPRDESYPNKHDRHDRHDVSENAARRRLFTLLGHVQVPHRHSHLQLLRSTHCDQ